MLHHDRAERSAEHNQKGGELQQHIDRAAFQELAAEDAADRDQQAEHAEDVHQYPRSVARRRATAWLWIWHTRDSDMPSTSPISRRFMSCS